MNPVDEVAVERELIRVLGQEPRTLKSLSGLASDGILIRILSRLESKGVVERRMGSGYKNSGSWVLVASPIQAEPQVTHEELPAQPAQAEPAAEDTKEDPATVIREVGVDDDRVQIRSDNVNCWLQRGEGQLIIRVGTRKSVFVNEVEIFNCSGDFPATLWIKF